ncbi:MAG: DUF4956 domain-containing protein, partial [Erysipelotrichaceae bacterium]
VVIMMVNGNVGTGVAVAGTFSLARFRSAPGSAKEIAGIFIAMASGLMLGMGYLGYSVLFATIVSFVNIIYNISPLGVNNNILDKTITITIPEDLNYTKVFDDLFKEYTTIYSLIKVKTTNLGSLFKITYNIKLKNSAKEKEFIDKLRVRNGNLEIAISPQQTTGNEL